MLRLLPLAVLLSTVCFEGYVILMSFRSERYLWFFWRGRGRYARRAIHPVLYWLGVGSSGLVLVFCLCAFARILFENSN